MKGQSGNAVESGNALFPMRYCRYENNMTEIKTSRDNTPITIRKDCAPTPVALQYNSMPYQTNKSSSAMRRRMGSDIAKREKPRFVALMELLEPRNGHRGSFSKWRVLVQSARF